MSDLPPGWVRAAANALWPLLRRAVLTGVWPRVTTDYRAYCDVPNHHSGGHATASGFRKQLPRHEPISPGHRILAEVKGDNWPGGLDLAVHLWKEAYELVETLIPDRAMQELHHAYHHSTCKAPFIVDKNRHGRPVLRRHNDQRALITLGVARALELTIAFTKIEIITRELDAAKIGDDDVHDIQPSVTFSIAQRAGIGAE